MRLKTANVLIVATAVVLTVTAVAFAAVTGNGQADHHKVQMVRACVSAGDQWVRGDCVRSH